jgi:L-asparagine transporter-like permease
LFAAVGNKYIIDSLLPESSSFTLVDSLHATTFMAIFLTLLVSAIALYYSDRDRLDKSSKVNYWGSRIVVIAYVVMNAVMIYRAV